MRIDLHVWLHNDPASHLILTKLGKVMTNQADHAAALAALAAQVAKTRAETLARVAELEAVVAEALAQVGGTTPEVDAAFDALRAEIQTSDDVVPDVA